MLYLPDSLFLYLCVTIKTSDKGEGWGAVLNEAMNSACAVVANSVIGSVPFLVNEDKNGEIYNGSFRDLYTKVDILLNNKEKCKVLGMNAYNTITKEWSPRIAAERISELSESLLKKSGKLLYKSGPCSKAEFIKNNWNKKGKNERDNI